MPADATKDASYQEQAQDLVFNENVLLQTLGFDVAVDHPHTHVVKTCHLVKGWFPFCPKKTSKYFYRFISILMMNLLNVYSLQRPSANILLSGLQ